MAKKYTIEDFIILYFKYKLAHVPKFIVRNSHLQLYLGEFIQRHYSEHYRGVSPETIARTWRRIRESNRLENESICAKKLSNISKTEDVYEIYYKVKVNKSGNPTLFD